MGVWDTGPFDNDTAADWCGVLQDAPPADRERLIRQALTAATAEVVGAVTAEKAVAAAAVVAAHRPGAPAVTTPYAPDFLVDGERLDLAADLAPLAAQAVRRIAQPDSEWHVLWADSEYLDQALAELTSLLELLDT